MASKWGSTDFSELQRFAEQLQSIDVNAFCESMAKELSQRLLRKVTLRTPVGSYEAISYTTKDGRTFTYNEGKQGGTLRRNWKAGASVAKTGSEYVIEVYNPLQYASYVEYGHRQQVGRFVPQIGKRLKNGWVEGKFMLKISEQEIQDIAPKLLEKKIKQLLKGALSS